MSYQTIKSAVQNGQCLTAMYQGRIRHFSPHAIGQGPDGSDNVMGYLYAGESSRPLPEAGEWRCFRVDGLSEVTTNNDPWHTRDDHSRPNRCVTQVDAEVQR